MSDQTSNPEVADFIKPSNQEHQNPSPAAGSAPIAPGQQLASPATTLAPTAAPVALQSPEPAPSTSALTASPQPRPLAYFTTPAKEVTKKQSVYLPVELHRALATVVNLPGVDVSLSDLLANIVQAWRDDHRTEVRKRYREGEKGI
ncbi:hypothetical protein [Hymenobacter sp. H14-R3]|uniref:hypothetical protein n=1 Tax=Hymenobacter sp. H14-R3 TaxID=3046308 RepID=UPI0024B881CC|nr:hypothetical protein [Hymenobacter sp. H14-R3]